MFRLLRALFLIAVLSVLALAPAGCKGGKAHMGVCGDCHTLTVEEADEILKTDKIQAKAMAVNMSPVKGLWEVELEKGGKKFRVYVDFEKKHLVEGRYFVPIDQIGKPPPMRKVDLTRIPIEDRTAPFARGSTKWPRR
jgi:thiol:disulfide interchange protein DsbC